MIRNKKIVVVLPAYNAAKTLETTYREIPFDIVDEVILVDDASNDNTVSVAKQLSIQVIEHEKNLGYGGNQKTCYNAALLQHADIIVMLHPDYQYTPKLISAMSFLLESGEFDVVLGSRILGGKAMSGGMPLYKYISNRFLTLVQNLLMGAKLSEYHTGYRAFTRTVLESIPFNGNSNDFVFDNEMLSQILYADFRVGEITCPAKYFADASSINFSRSVKYGLGCLKTAIQFRLNKLGILRSSIFTYSRYTKQ
ncbi:MAG: glycosyltransferase family 2 protein [Bacteroidota bacterium]|nr:glycosyltransferase family 2 protein [Bacteroidota bacterium]